MMGQRQARRLVHAEYAYGQTAHGARDAVAVQVQRSGVRRADIGDHVHGHAVDHVEEILLAQMECFNLAASDRSAAGAMPA